MVRLVASLSLLGGPNALGLEYIVNVSRLLEFVICGVSRVSLEESAALTLGSSIWNKRSTWSK